MNKVLFLLFTCLIFSCESLKCDNFKKGNFIVPSDTESTRPYRIIRSDNTQIEIDSKGVKRYSKVKWLDNCNYILLYDADKMILNSFQKEVNNFGGIIVKVTKIEGNCFYYTSNIKGDPPSKRIDGVMCKE
jgi:hypothetical protein